MDAWPGAGWERSTGDRLTIRQVKGIIEGASTVGTQYEGAAVVAGMRGMTLNRNDRLTIG